MQESRDELLLPEHVEINYLFICFSSSFFSLIISEKWALAKLLLLNCYHEGR